MNVVQHLNRLRALTRSITTRSLPIASSSSLKVNNGLATPVLNQNRSVPKQTARNLSSGLTSSTVHPALASIYKPGELLKQGNRATRLHRLYDPELPDWGPWGVSIALSTAKVGSKQFVMTFPHFWLRDNCRCEQCVNQDTMQRAFDTFSIPIDIIPQEVVTTTDGLQVKWPNEHVSIYKWNWLLKHAAYPASYPKPVIDIPKEELQKQFLWTREIKSNPPTVEYADVMRNDKGVGEWLEKLRIHGFCYVDGCPVSPEATKELLERIAFIRETHYGGFYDFTADLTMKDTAYTNLALPAHTDTTYFTDPAGLQMFHLLSHTEGNGGASLLVDGFHAAKKLQRLFPKAYDVLATTAIPAHASGNAGITITPARKFPVLNCYPTPNELMQIRWNNDDRGVLPLKQTKTWNMEWYKAAAKWNSILKSDDLQYWAQLEPGRPLIFDNWRVLHGRSAFTGKRRICGGYTNHDDYISRWRNTNFSKEEVLGQIL